jgi:anti-sigma B factor antagonist
MDGSQLLQVATERNGSAVIVRVEGEVDMNTVSAFGGALAQACDLVAPPMRVVADLTGVTFLSSAGLTALLEVHHRCERQGTPLRVEVTHPTVRRALEITGVDQILDLRCR